MCIIAKWTCRTLVVRNALLPFFYYVISSPSTIHANALYFFRTYPSIPTCRLLLSCNPFPCSGMGFPPSSVKEGGANLLYNSPPPIRPTALATVAGHGDYVKCLTYAPQGGLLVSGGLDKRILLWNLERMAAPLMVLRTGDGDGMGAGALPSSASLGRVVNGPGGQDWGLGSAGVGSSGSKGMGAGGVSSVPRWGSGGPWFHVRDPSRVLLRPGVAAAGQGEVFELCRQNKGSVYCVDASVDAALVASGGTDRMIRLLDPRVGAGRVAKICKLDGHRDNVRCVRIDEGGTRVVSSVHAWWVIVVVVVVAGNLLELSSLFVQFEKEFTTCRLPPLVTVTDLYYNLCTAPSALVEVFVVSSRQLSQN